MKASKGSERLTKLQSASRGVNGATARVVASTNAGRRQLDETGDSLKDLQSTVTLTQIKRKEMDSQVCWILFNPFAKSGPFRPFDFY